MRGIEHKLRLVPGNVDQSLLIEFDHHDCGLLPETGLVIVAKEGAPPAAFLVLKVIGASAARDRLMPIPGVAGAGAATLASSTSNGETIENALTNSKPAAGKNLMGGNL